MNRYILLCATILACGCSRDLKKSHSNIAIRIPQKQSLSLSSLNAIPANRKACYGVSVTGPNIPKNSVNSCSPELGIVAGFKESNGLLEMTVPKGSSRKIELYLYLEDVGANDPCPVMGSSFTETQLSNVYLLGTAPNVNLVADIEEVDITAVFPGEAINIAQQLALPVTCGAAAAPLGSSAKFQTSVSNQTATGTGVKLIGRMGGIHNYSEMTGTGIRLRTR